MSSKRLGELRAALPSLDISTSEYAVLSELVYRESESGMCCPSIRTIAKYVHASERAVQRWLKSLSKKGHITITIGKNKYGHQSSNHYKINLPRTSNRCGNLSSGVNNSHPNNIPPTTYARTTLLTPLTPLSSQKGSVGAKGCVGEGRFARAGDQPSSSHSSRTLCSFAVPSEPSCEGGMPTVVKDLPFDKVPENVMPFEISEQQARDFGKSIAVEDHEEKVMDAAQSVWLGAKLDQYGSECAWRRVSSGASWKRYYYDEISNLVGIRHLMPQTFCVCSAQSDARAKCDTKAKNHART